jgi:hypothetical protein
MAAPIPLLAPVMTARFSWIECMPMILLTGVADSF